MGAMSGASMANSMGLSTASTGDFFKGVLGLAPMPMTAVQTAQLNAANAQEAYYNNLNEADRQINKETQSQLDYKTNYMKGAGYIQ